MRVRKSEVIWGFSSKPSLPHGETGFLYESLGTEKALQYAMARASAEVENYLDEDISGEDYDRFLSVIPELRDFTPPTGTQAFVVLRVSFL